MDQTEEVKQAFKDNNVITLTSIKNLLKRKISHKGLPPNWKTKVELYLKDKQQICDDHKAMIGKNPIATQEIYDKEVKQLKVIKRICKWMDFDTDVIDLPNNIPVAGISKTGLVIEPISQFDFVYNWCGFKGLARVNEMPGTKQKFIEIEGQQILLNSDPIKEFCYDLPDSKVIKKWLNGDIESCSTEELYVEMKRYFKTFVDLQDDCLYDVLVLFVFQTWLTDMLNSVFYLAIMAAWGSGKTITGELTTSISRHGYFGSTSLAFIARMMDQQKITLFLDEIDSMVGTEDSEIFSILRQGYRRGAKYGRICKDSMNPQTFNVFGAKLFSIYSGTEAALLNRSIPITLTQSTDSQLPIVNSKKSKYGYKLLNKLYLWYLDNVLYYVDTVDDVDYTYKEDIYENRNAIHKNAVSLLHVRSTGQLSQLSGRNAELGHIMAILANIIGVDVGTEEGNINLEKIFAFKDEVESERMEIGSVAILRELCIELFTKHKHSPVFITPEGFFKISNKYLFQCFNTKLRSEKEFGCSPEKFQGYLRELGFERPHSRKKVRIKDPGENGDGKTHVRLCNIYTPQVIKKMGLPAVCLDPVEGGEKIENVKA